MVEAPPSGATTRCRLPSQIRTPCPRTIVVTLPKRPQLTAIAGSVQSIDSQSPIRRPDSCEACAWMPWTSGHHFNSPVAGVARHP